MNFNYCNVYDLLIKLLLRLLFYRINNSLSGEYNSGIHDNNPQYASVNSFSSTVS